VFYLRFARRTRKVLVVSAEGTEVIDSPEVIRTIRRRAKEVSSRLRLLSSRFGRRSEIPRGFEILPQLGDQYCFRSLAREEEGEYFSTPRPPPWGPDRANGLEGSALSHLVIRARASSRDYVVQYAGERSMRTVLDVAFFMRGLVSRELLGRGKFEQLLDYRRELGGTYLDSVAPGLPRRMRESLLEHAAFRSVGLSKLYPLYADPSVQEMYLDAVGSKVYVDHATCGRLVTNIRLNLEDVESLVANLRRNTGLRLDLKVPSIKGDLVTRHCTSRVSIDSYPLVVGRYAVDIRKLRPSPLSMMELIDTGFLSVEAASLLMSFLFHRMNISIVGEPGSGKTTLLASLDAMTPDWWRKIYLEDCVEIFPESRRSTSRGLHLVVDPFESKGASRRKSSEIVKLLHRNPSYVVLGEVQFSDHFRALFHAMAAGIRVIHTSHASGAADFIRRVTKVYGIPVELVANLDLMAFLRKEEHELGTVRSIASLTAICDPDGSDAPELLTAKVGCDTAGSGDGELRAIVKSVEAKRELSNGCLMRSYEEIKRVLGALSSQGVRDLQTAKRRLLGAYPSLAVIN
jgi:type IV secretory pathway ATPase VirB11/archaellum biosynthesis ATPase